MLPLRGNSARPLTQRGRRQTGPFARSRPGRASHWVRRDARNEAAWAVERTQVLVLAREDFIEASPTIPPSRWAAFGDWLSAFRKWRAGSRRWRRQDELQEAVPQGAPQTGRFVGEALPHHGREGLPVVSGQA